MQIVGVDVGELAKPQIPGVSIIDIEIEIRVLVLVRLLEHRVLDGVALAQRTVAMHVVVHPLVDGRCLLADRLERRVRLEQRHPGGHPIVRDAVHPNFAIVVGDVLHQPVDAVVGVGRLAGRFRIGKIHRRGQPEDSFRLEAPAQVLDDEDVAVLRQLLPARWNLGQRSARHPVWCSAKENGKRPGLIDRRKDHRLQMHAVADGNHHFPETVGGWRRRLLREQSRGERHRHHEAWKERFFHDRMTGCYRCVFFHREGGSAK